MSELPAAIGVIGGSGLYQIGGLETAREIEVDTPFGKPSDAIMTGLLGGRPVFFLPRHGRGHRILPTELNHRANIFALRSLNVRWLISVGAVGSLQEKYAPRDLVCRLLLEKKKSQIASWTFFAGDIIAQVSLADPVSAKVKDITV